jgi:HlyD family secretion protein
MFFYYPDVISSEATITTEHPSVWVVARSSGKITDLRVKDKQQVEENELLAVIDNAARYQDVETLKSCLKVLQAFYQDYDTSKLQLPQKELQLGELQDAYSRFYSECEEYIHFLEQGNYPKKIKAITEKLNNYMKYRNLLERQQNYQEQSMKWSQNQMESADFRCRFGESQGRSESQYKVGRISLYGIRDNTGGSIFHFVDSCRKNICR